MNESIFNQKSDPPSEFNISPLFLPYLTDRWFSVYFPFGGSHVILSRRVVSILVSNFEASKFGHWRWRHEHVFHDVRWGNLSFFFSGTCWGRLCWCLRCHYTTNFRGIEQYTCMVILSFSSCDSALFRLVIHWPVCFFSFLCEAVFSSGVCLYVDVSKLRFRVMCWCMFDVSEKMIFFRGFRWCNAKVYLSKKIAIPHQLALQAFSSVDLFHVDQDGTWG